ncbi:MAG: hypothetical protein AAF639_25060, partial [Chloroflexota bacterium]
FGQDPLTCWKCRTTDMVLYSLSIPEGNGLKTIGGDSWLYARGDWIESPPDSGSPPPDTSSPPSVSINPQPSSVQLSFAFPAAA